MAQKKISFHQLPQSHGVNLFQNCFEGDKPRQGEMNSQILYSEPEGLDTKKDLPTISKNSFKKGVYY